MRFYRRFQFFKGDPPEVTHECGQWLRKRNAPLGQTAITLRALHDHAKEGAEMRCEIADSQFGAQTRAVLEPDSGSVPIDLDRAGLL